MIPPEFFKVNRKHALILNDVAWPIVEAKRGGHEKYVFTKSRKSRAEKETG